MPVTASLNVIVYAIVPTEVVYAPGLVVKDAVGATVSTVMVRVDGVAIAKLFDASLIAFALRVTDPLVPVVQFASVSV
jgi:hypothetical protein